tara:strand:- start:62 stop:382 length:321 start_codon:yes stop_codon:yes gene_type:complete
MLVLANLANKLNRKNIHHIKNVLVINSLFIFIFACIYYMYGDGDNFNLPSYYGENGKMNFIDCVYFSGITHLTVGYGDIAGKSSFIKLVIICQLFIMILLLGVDLN